MMLWLSMVLRIEALSERAWSESGNWTLVNVGDYYLGLKSSLKRLAFKGPSSEKRGHKFEGRL
jgi:hypothetical protein